MGGKVKEFSSELFGNNSPRFPYLGKMLLPSQQNHTQTLEVSAYTS